MGPGSGPDLQGGAAGTDVDLWLGSQGLGLWSREPAWSTAGLHLAQPSPDVPWAPHHGLPQARRWSWKGAKAQAQI